MGKQKEVCKVPLINLCFSKIILYMTDNRGCVSEVEKLDENLYEKASEEAGPQKRYYFENLKISLPQVKLSVLTSNKLPPELKVKLTHQHSDFYFIYLFFSENPSFLDGEA